MKKFLLMFIIAVLVGTTIPTNEVLASEYLVVDESTDIMYSGQDGDIYWSIDSNGKLYLEGDGDGSWINPDDWFSSPEWCSETIRGEIKSAEVHIKNIHNACNFFADCYNLTEVDLHDFDTSNVYDMSKMFSGCTSLTELNLSGLNTSQVTTMHSMFHSCRSLTSLNLNGFNTSRVTDMSGMFGYCLAMKELDLSEFDTSNVAEMGCMFSDCQSLQALNVSGFNTSKVINMEGMFANCSLLEELDLSNFDTSQVTDMEAMFYYCTSLKHLDLSGFDTSQVKWMQAMFRYCESLERLDLTGFNLLQVRSVGNMFRGCKNLSTEITINNNVETYIECFVDAATAPNTVIYVRNNGICTREYAQAIVNTKSNDSHVYFVEPETIRFNDVSESAYYYEAVQWAIKRDITGGTSDTTFSPNQNCTRAQVMTFLWKANGSPEPKSTRNPFTDIKSSNYYYKAVLWAVENGITEGATATTFAPSKECTREQVVSFIWKAAGEPEPAAVSNPFTDVSSMKYYYKPVMWAVENGIASGATNTTFGTGKICNRAQVMTFLYNAYR